MKKIFFFWCCYFPILVGCFYSGEAGLGEFAVGFVSFWTGVFILFFQTDIKQYKQFCKHQFIGTALGYICSAGLFLKNSSNDFETQAVLLLFVFVGLVMVALQILIGFLISKCFKRNRKAE